jgi:hypothetical protein
MSVRLLKWLSLYAVAAAVAASVAACSSSGGPAPAGLAGSQAASPSGTVSAAAEPATTAPAPGGGSNAAFCRAYVKAFAQDSAGNTPPLTPTELILIDQADAAAPATVKSDMDVIDASMHQAARGNLAGADQAEAQDSVDVLLWMSHNCRGVLSTAS